MFESDPERTGPARRAAELALVRVCHHYGGRPEFVLASTRPTMEFVTALYASGITGGPVNRAELVPGHPFYTALNGGIDQATIAQTFSI